MAEYERRELNLPADSFELSEGGELVVRSDRLAKAFQDAGVAPGKAAASGEVSVGVVVSRSF
jgi:hypothetical protein